MLVILKNIITLLFLLLSLGVQAQLRENIKPQFLNRLHQGDQIKIAALGTSLTGGTWRWFDVMKEWLDEEYSGQISYHNLGVGASASSYPSGNSGLARVRELVKINPDVVFIEFAVNDAYKPYNIIIEDSRRNLESIIRSLKSANPEVEIILQTMNVVIDMPELNMFEATKRSDLELYHEMYRDVAVKKDILLIDHYQNWKKYLEGNGRDAYIKIVKDGIHPQLYGYRKVLLPELKRVLQGKWISESENQERTSREVDDFLESLGGSLRILRCKYDKAVLTSSAPFRESELITSNEHWETDINVSKTNDESNSLDLEIGLKLISGHIEDAGVAIAFDFTNWDTDNYVMLPASIYNGNRCKLVNRGYNAGLERKYLYKKDIPLMSVFIPQLSPDEKGISRFEVNSSNLATPAMCFYNKLEKRGFIVLAEQKTRFGDNAFSLEESVDRESSSFVISAPGVRERKPLFVGFDESSDRGVDFKTGDDIRLKFKIYTVDAEDIPGFLAEFMKIRKALTGQNHPRNLIPFSQVKTWMTERIDERWYEDENYQFYCPENANWISFGWVGGLMNTFPMLSLGDKKHQDKTFSTFDFAIPRGQGESGYFYGALNYDGKVFPREGYPEIPELVLSRKNADVLYWMIKQFSLLHAQGHSLLIKPDWEHNIQRLADAFVKTWKKNGQWGRMLNNKTGEVAEYNTSGGVMAIGGLALASKYYQNADYLKVAKEAAEFYYHRDFEGQGQTTGGCADILQNADSETAAGFMTALMTLYEVTGEFEWLEKSRDLANLCATWTTSYDYELPDETELGRLDAKLAGIYWASTQNKHGAPGICTNSGDALFKIYRRTGDKLYADLLNDIIHAHAESIRPGGYTNERLTYCDADSRGERGTHVTGWNELNGFLMALEIPGIYLQTDTNQLYVFDHVEVRIVKRNDRKIVLEISNPTEYDASVTIFAESYEDARKSLGQTGFMNWSSTKIKSGESKLVSVRSKSR